MITANITRSSTIRLNCGLVVLPLGLFLVCSSSSWRISQSFDFPPRNDLVRLRRIFVFPNVSRTFLCSRSRNSIKYERALLTSSFQIKLGPTPNARCSPQTIGISQNRKTQKCQYDRTRNCFNVHRAINCDWRVTWVSCGRNHALVRVFQMFISSFVPDVLVLKDLRLCFLLNRLRVLTSHFKSWLLILLVLRFFIRHPSVTRQKLCALSHVT